MSVSSPDQLKWRGTITKRGDTKVIGVDPGGTGVLVSPIILLGEGPKNKCSLPIIGCYESMQLNYYRK